MRAKNTTVEMNNGMLAEVFRRSARALLEMGAEAEEDLLAAIAANAEEAQNQGKQSLTMSLGHSIKIDLSKGTQKDTLGWKVSCKTEREGRLDDPAQEKLDFED